MPCARNATVMDIIARRIARFVAVIVAVRPLNVRHCERGTDDEERGAAFVLIGPLTLTLVFLWLRAKPAALLNVHPLRDSNPQSSD